ncbi:MAG TPA: DNA replication/repair protein RecF [Clostridia bacterium]|jgi:DNA replication and repair protein RecF|nr:DNA replication/repair protein RecF [Clostridia bacterium]
MIVDRIILKNFLSYGVVDMTPGPGINLITGGNAAGKTNLIDSIYLSAVGKGSRNRDNKEYIKWGSTGGAEICIVVKKKYSRHVIQTHIDENGGKRMFIDGMPLTRMGDLMGILQVIFFAPTELNLIKGGPSERRRFLDISICQQSKTYFYTLLRLESQIEQRNKVLKEYKNKPTQRSIIESMDDDFLRSAAFIIDERRKFIEEIAPIAARIHKELTLGEEELTIAYETEPIHGETFEELKRLTRDVYDRDVENGYTNVGPHRDDLKVVANGIDLRRFGSQGQQRTAVLSLKLASAEIMGGRNKESPVFLLDDVMGELDDDRKKALLKTLDGKQVFITDATQPEGLGKKVKVFKIQETEVKTKDQK